MPQTRTISTKPERAGPDPERDRSLTRLLILASAASSSFTTAAGSGA